MCTHVYAGADEVRDLFAHEGVEVRVETVDGAVDTDGDARLRHLVEQRGDAGRHEVRRAPRHALAHVPHAGHVRLGRVRQTYTHYHITY